MTERQWLTQLEVKASKLRHQAWDLTQRPYSASERELRDLLCGITALYYEVRANRQASGAPAPAPVRVVPAPMPAPSSLTEDGAVGEFDA